MSAQDNWQRKHNELWEKLKDNTRSSFCTALWKWLVLYMRHVMQTPKFEIELQIHVVQHSL